MTVLTVNYLYIDWSFTTVFEQVDLRLAINSQALALIGLCLVLMKEKLYIIVYSNWYSELIQGVQVQIFLLNLKLSFKDL